MSEDVQVYEGEVMDETLPVIMDDRLIQLADQAERRIDAMLTIKRAVLRITNSKDWIDQQGKPYLQVSGSEKVGRLFGLSWDVDKNPTIDEYPDGHFTYIFRGTFMWENSTITAEGSRSSRDPFFSKRKGESIPPSEIDRRDVRMAAYTNLLGNGITRLLGIRNLTWEEVQAGGIKKGESSKVTYKEDSPEIKEQRAKIKEWLLELCGGDKAVAADMLEEMTSFTNKANEKVKGKRKIDALTEKQVPIVYGKLKKEHEEFEKAFEGVGDEPDTDS